MPTKDDFGGARIDAARMLERIQSLPHYKTFPSSRDELVFGYVDGDKCTAILAQVPIRTDFPAGGGEPTRTVDMEQVYHAVLKINRGMDEADYNDVRREMATQIAVAVFARAKAANDNTPAANTAA